MKSHIKKYMKISMAMLFLIFMSMATYSWVMNLRDDEARRFRHEFEDVRLCAIYAMHNSPYIDSVFCSNIETSLSIDNTVTFSNIPIFGTAVLDIEAMELSFGVPENFYNQWFCRSVRLMKLYEESASDNIELHRYAFYSSIDGRVSVEAFENYEELQRTLGEYTLIPQQQFLNVCSAEENITYQLIDTGLHIYKEGIDYVE